MLAVGIVGAGNIAQVHGQCWSRLPVEIRGWFDLAPAAARRAAQRWGGVAHESLEALIEQCDVIDVCTNVTAHKEPVIAAARQGKAIVCEKPLARTVADCEDMLQVCRAEQVPLFVAHVVRFFPQFEAARQAVVEGAVGVPGAMRTVRAFAFPAAPSSPAAQRYADFAQSGGVVMDVAIHDLDFHRWCLGEIDRVFARGLLEAQAPHCDHALISLRFASGAVGHIEASWAHIRGRSRTMLEIAGTAGLIEWDSREPDALELLTDASAELAKPMPLAPPDQPYYKELAHFLHCLERRLPFRVSPRDALMAVKAAQAVLHSIRTGRPVALADFQEPA